MEYLKRRKAKRQMTPRLLGYESQHHDYGIVRRETSRSDRIKPLPSVSIMSCSLPAAATNSFDSIPDNVIQPQPILSTNHLQQHSDHLFVLGQICSGNHFVQSPAYLVGFIRILLSCRVMRYKVLKTYVAPIAHEITKILSKVIRYLGKLPNNELSAVIPAE